MEILDNRINIEQKKIELNDLKNNEKKYIYLVISLFLLSGIISCLETNTFLSLINPIIFFSAVIITIYAKITNKNSKKIKILFYIVISYVIIYILSLLLLFITCIKIINMGCS